LDSAVEVSRSNNSTVSFPFRVVHYWFLRSIMRSTTVYLSGILSSPAIVNCLDGISDILLIYSRQLNCSRHCIGVRLEWIHCGCSPTSDRRCQLNGTGVSCRKIVQHQKSPVQCERADRSHWAERWKRGRNAKSSSAIGPPAANDQLQQQPHVHSLRTGGAETGKLPFAEPKTTAGKNKNNN
jgi:hypothetical protein